MSFFSSFLFFSSLTGWVDEGPVTKWRGGVKAEVGTETSYWMCWRWRQTYEVWCQVISGGNHHSISSERQLYLLSSRAVPSTVWPAPTADGTLRRPLWNIWRSWGETATSSGYISDCGALPLPLPSLPVNYGGRCACIPHPPSSSLVYLQTVWLQSDILGFFVAIFAITMSKWSS